MSVYIKGLEMPNKGKRALWVVIHSDGTVEYDTGDYGWQTLRQSAVPVPPHGRLIDADEMLGHRFVGVVGEAEKSSYMVGWNTAIEAIVENAPAIIPASEEEDNG